MASRGGDASTSMVGKGKKGVRSRKGVKCADSRKSIEQLNVREFKEHFRIPYGIPMHLLGVT